MNNGNLIVSLNNEAKESQEGWAGNYILAPNMVNEKKHWLKEGGIGSIWYCNTGTGFWVIGPQSHIGGSGCTCGLHAPGDSTGPETATGWKYTDGSWHEPSNDNDILVELGNTTTV